MIKKPLEDARDFLIADSENAVRRREMHEVEEIPIWGMTSNEEKTDTIARLQFCLKYIRVRVGKWCMLSEERE
jgi:hypothetical protein